MKPASVVALLLVVLSSLFWSSGCGDGDQLPDSFSRRPEQPGGMSMTVGTQDQTVFGDQLLYLFATRVGGSGSAKIEWKQTGGPPVQLEKANTQNPSFIAPRVAETTPLRFEVKANDAVGATAAAAIRVIVEVPEIAVEAGLDMDSAGGHRVTLHGSARGFYGAPTLTWAQTAGPGVTLSAANVLNPSFVLPVVGEAAVLGFELTATDGTRTGKDFVSVRVDPTPFIVDVSDDQTVGEKQIVALHAVANGAASPTIAWTQTAGPTVTLQNATTLNPTFESPVVNAPTTLAFEVTGTDGARTARGILSVAVQPSLPIAFAGTDTQVAESTVMTLAGQARGGIPPYAYSWTQTAGAAVQLAEEATATPTFTAGPVTANETLTFRLTVTDSAGHTATDDVTVTVYDAPQGALTAQAGSDATIDEGSIVRLRGVGYGGTPPYTYAWRVKNNGGATGITTSVPGGAPMDVIVNAPAVATPKIVVLELKVTDSAAGGAATALDEVSMTISPMPFAVSAGADRGARVGDTVRLQAHVTNDRDGLGFNWAAVSGPMATLVGGNTANPSFVAATAGTYVFRVTATDRIQSGTDEVSITVATAPPAASAGTDMKVSVADLVHLHALVAGGTAPFQYAWTLEEGPQTTIDGATTGNPSFTAPTVVRDTVMKFGLTVTDATAAKAKATVRVTLLVPQLTVKTGEKGAVPDHQNVSFNATATGGIPPYTYAWRQAKGAPDLKLTGGDTPNPTLASPALTEDTTFEFIVSVTDKAGSVANATTHLTITRAPPVATGPTKSPNTTFQCGNIDTKTSCSEQEVSFGESRLCPPERPYAMTDVFHENGRRSIYKRCVDGATCDTEWFHQTSERNECKTYDPNTANLNAILVCHFCCVTDDCNSGIRPADATLYRPN